MARAVNYRSLYAVPKETFDAFIKHKTGNFPNVKSLKVNQLNFNDAKHINPQHLGPNGFPTNPRRRGPQVPNDPNDRSQGVSLLNISGDNNERTNEETEATADDERRSNNPTNNESEERRSNNATEEEDAMTVGSVGGGGDDSMSVGSIGGGGNDSMSVGSIGGGQSNGAQQEQQQGMNLSEEAQLIHNSLNAVPNNLQMARDRQIFNQANESNVLLPRNMGPEFQNATEHNASNSLQSIGQEDIPANNIVSSTINEASRASNPPLSPIIPPNYQLRVPQPGLLNQATPIPQPGTPNQSGSQFANSVRNAQPDPSAQSDSSPQFQFANAAQSDPSSLAQSGSSPQFQSQFANSVRNAQPDPSTPAVYASQFAQSLANNVQKPGEKRKYSHHTSALAQLLQDKRNIPPKRSRHVSAPISSVMNIPHRHVPSSLLKKVLKRNAIEAGLDRFGEGLDNIARMQNMSLPTNGNQLDNIARRQNMSLPTNGNQLSPADREARKYHAMMRTDDPSFRRIASPSPRSSPHPKKKLKKGRAGPPGQRNASPIARRTRAQQQPISQRTRAQKNKKK